MKDIIKKKILIVTGIYPPDIGGPASYARTLAQRLSKDYEVKVITYSSVRKFKQDRDYPFQVKRVWKKNFWIFRHVIYAFKVLCACKNSDVIYSLSTLNGAIPSLMGARFFKKKFYLRIAGDYAWQVAVEKNKTGLLIDDFQKSKKTGWIGMLHRIQVWACKSADEIIVPSKYLASIVRGWGVLGDKIKVIYNGVDFKGADISQEEAKKKLGIYGDIILSAGRLVPWKGFRMLIKIMPRLSEISQLFRLVIVGDGPDQKMLGSMVKNLGLERKIYLVGRKSQEELAIYLAAADMFVLNTGYEGFSHQILEAMTAGVPVITTAVGGNKEVIQQGENGFMVKYQDEFNLVEAVKSLWQNPELQEEFKKEGKKTAEHFSSDKMFEETVKILTR
jgi:glycosyltransferase involved in cell wall biosynthesis